MQSGIREHNSAPEQRHKDQDINVSAAFHEEMLEILRSMHS